jgi:hypothetical protein
MGIIQGFAAAAKIFGYQAPDSRTMRPVIGTGTRPPSAPYTRSTSPASRRPTTRYTMVARP